MKLLGKLVWRGFLIIISAIFVLQIYFFVQIWWLIDHNPSSTSFMRHQISIIRKTDSNFQLQYIWVPYNRISTNLKRAIIASEDANFSEHEGIDWDALEKAYERNMKKGKVMVGGSTITQQLAKNLFLSSERSYIRKGQEFIITYMLEYLMDKERIYEIYLNVVEWGNGVYGAEAASRHYYKRSAANLGASQAARLAVMLPRPHFYDKNRGSSYLSKRTCLILRRMGSAEL
ncbi:MAG: monofunctional biosynthetic peptidoglycan transglycosylase, partial [Glaciimonas sp.]|nr:monofunctional biosynthetic peptidoglycan transglycosylase [Glaciimonas sp.]